MTKQTLTQKRLKELLYYDSEAGLFTWIKSGSGRRINLIAGHAHKETCGKEYIQIVINGINYRAHRLAFLYMNGSLPKHETDHIDGNGLNNIFSNIKEVTKAENNKNKRRPSNNTSGCIGVGRNKGKWIAYIKINQKMIHLGYFVTKFAAVYARHEANIKYSFHQNHGQIRPL